MAHEDVPSQGHHAGHHRKTRHGRKKCRHDPRTAQDLNQGSSSSRRAGDPCAGSLCQQGADALGVRTHVQDQNQTERHEASSAEPRRHKLTSLRPLSGKERNEDEWAQDRAEGGTEQDQRYAFSPALGRVHVGRCSAREHHRAVRSPDEDKPKNHRHRGEQRSPEANKHTPQDAKSETPREYGNPTEAVHRPSRGESGECRRAHEYGRPQPDESLQAGDGFESDRGHRRPQLNHPVERRHSERHAHPPGGLSSLLTCLCRWGFCPFSPLPKEPQSAWNPSPATSNRSRRAPWRSIRPSSS